MRTNIIIGTSGHIDHGKTAMIKALTGCDADRLKAEKMRGITIELGFVHYVLDENKSISFIDVPGHERFLHNMLSGVTGMDAVLLVVSADEGIKPQTKEHLKILKILGVKKGAVVLTKIDLVSKDKIAQVRSDILDLVHNSFLENQPIFEFSIYDEHSQADLWDYFRLLFDEVTEHVLDTSSRLSIDRVFSLTGHGTIVTGTLIEGIITKDKPLYIYPDVQKVRIRNIQVNGHDVKAAFAGQRVALNIPVPKGSLRRGYVLSSSEQLPVTQIIDVKLFDDLFIMDDFFHWQRVRIHHGTSEIFGRIVLNSSFSKASPFLQIRLEAPLVCKVGDRLVIRSYSPIGLLGGGYIVNTAAKKGILTETDIVNESIGQIRALLDHENGLFKVTAKLFESLPLKFEECLELYSQLVELKEVVAVGQVFWCTQRYRLDLEQNALQYINDYHLREPLKRGMPKEVLKSKLGIASKILFDALIGWLLDSNTILEIDDKISDVHFIVRYSESEKAIHDELIQMVKASEFKPMSIKALCNSINMSKKHYDIFINLINERILVKINEDTVIYYDNYEIVYKKLKAYLKQNREISVANFRDLMAISRKASILLLDHFDDIGLTKRIEDVRVLIK